MAEQTKRPPEPTATIQTVPRAYLKPSDIQKFSMWHTAYVADPDKPTQLHKLEIVGGMVRNLPLNIYQRFADAGILTTERPRRQGEDEEG